MNMGSFLNFLTLSLDKILFLNLSDTDWKFNTRAISPTKKHTTFNLLHYAKNNTFSSGTGCVISQLFKLSTDKELQIWPARRVPEIDLWSILAWFGMSCWFLKYVSSSMITSQSIFHIGTRWKHLLLQYAGFMPHHMQVVFELRYEGRQRHRL